MRANGRLSALDYLRVSHLFQLGHLPTEQPHPATRRLSHWAQNDLAHAVEVLWRIDRDTLATLEGYAGGIDELRAAIGATLDAGKRIFLCGCGATGRLALSLEVLWRRHSHDDRVVAFMAGGDVALVNSLEGFEDHPEHGARHLGELGFADGDLLVACTEGGETPYVIGATREAAQRSANGPFFLYCNSDEALLRAVDRFRHVHDDARIRKLCLFVGPMALTGSTRMQASTVLQLAVGAALLHRERPAAETIGRHRERHEATDPGFLPEFVERESEIYANGGRVVYRVRDYGITVFTDTTERAPTFSMVPFAPRNGRPGSDAARSLCSIVLDDAGDSDAAWRRLLERDPRPLDWPEVDPRTTRDHLRRFDFSAQARESTAAPPAEFQVGRSGDAIRLQLDGLEHHVPAGTPELSRHLLLKQILNIHSTLVMGRLGRYQDNLMTWVTPTNGKLIDRAARYVRQLLINAGHGAPAYDVVVRHLFAEMDAARPDESVVLRTYRALAR